MPSTFYVLEPQESLESNISPFWPYNNPWYGCSAAQCWQSEGEALERFQARQFTTVWESEVTAGLFVSVFIYIYVCVCICQCVALDVRVGFFIVPEGFGFGKANLGLRALGLCQAHQPILYAVCYRTAPACTHACEDMPPPNSFPRAQSFIHQWFQLRSTLLKLVPACVSFLLPNCSLTLQKVYETQLKNRKCSHREAWCLN